MLDDPKPRKSVLQDLRDSGIEIYDNSSLSALITCPRMFYYRHELGLAPRQEEPSTPLQFGLSVHLALETWQARGKDDSQAIAHFVESFSPYEESPTIGKSGKELGATYTVLYGCSLLGEYFHKYRSDNREIVQLETPLAEEVEPGTYIAGRVDKIVRGSYGLVFADYKTTKYMNDFLINPNPQFMTYKFMCEKLTGERVSGELDVLGVSKTKPLAELLRREPFDYTDYQMTEWRKSVTALIKLVGQYRSAEFWPQTWRCRPFFRDCSFMPLCTLPSREPHDRLIEELYEVKRWDPFQEPTD
jgi:hypothetical protein